MIKKTIAALLLALLGLAGAYAQQKEGRWTIFPSVTDLYSAVVETPGRTYLLSGSDLYSLSDRDGENYAYNMFNKLTERAAIGKIAYNKQKKYLLVAYQNGNIDLLYDSGKTVNLPQIKDATLSVSRNIIDVVFGFNRIFVATDFGLVVFDDDKNLVVESGIYNQPVDHIFLMGEHLVMTVGEKIYVSRYDDRHIELARLRRAKDMFKTDVAKANDNVLIYNYTGDNHLYAYTFDFASNKESDHHLYALADKVELCQADGGVYCVDNHNIVHIGSDLNVQVRTLPSDYKVTTVFLDDLSSVWVNTPQGITHLDMSATVPTVLMEPYYPEGITTSRPYRLRFSADGNKLYVGNYTVSFLTDAGNSNHPWQGPNKQPQHYLAQTSVIENGRITDVQPAVYTPGDDINSTFKTVQTSELRTTRIIGGCLGIAVDPDDPDLFYIANWVGGLFAIKNGEVQHVVTWYTCPLSENRKSTDRFNHVDIDPEGNLWIMKGLDDAASAPHVLMLPAAKRKNIKAVTREDWVAVPMRSDFVTSRDAFTTFCRKSKINIITPGGWDPLIVFQAHNGTYTDTSDDRYAYFKGYTDQNGNTLSPRHVSCIVEDHDGRVWVGMHMGTFVIDNPAECFGDRLDVRRPIVPRNDGTGLGDYLLESSIIYSIAVDAANRKWYGTNSGVYLVSDDGTEILAHYDTDNSPLPSNTVAAIACDPHGNRVYFGTDNGLVCYESDAAPAADDYSEVYAYPNPVRPEYTGWITVAGLKDSSLVKIADVAGNVFFQGRSEGGMISWDGCDPSGRRVKSGVYFVFASDSAEYGSGDGAVAKILVIN